MSPRPLVARTLWGLAVVSAILLATFGAWWSTLPLRDAAIERAHRETQLEALSLSELLAAVTRSAMSSLNAIDLSMQAHGGPRSIPPAEVGAELQRQSGDEIGTQAMLVVDATGTVVASAGLPETPEGSNVRQRPTFAYHFDHPAELGPRVGKAHLSELTGGWVLPVSRIIASPEGEMLGVVSVAINLSRIRELYEQMGNLREANFAVVTRDGEVIVRYPFLERAIGFQLAGNTRPPLEGTGSYEAKSQIDGVTRILGYRQLEDLNAVMLVGFPRDQVLATWADVARERTTWTAASLSLLAVLCYAAWFARRRHARQLRAIEQVFEKRETELRQEVDEIESFSVDLSRSMCEPLGHLRRLLQLQPGQATDTRSHAQQQALASTIRMEGLAQGVSALALARTTPVKRQDLDVSAMARAIARSLQAGDPGRTVDIRVDDEMYTTADYGLLNIVLANLIGNAWKFSTGRPQTVIQVGVRKGLNETVFFVRDNGPGFDPADAQSIFKPFHRLENAAGFEGHGIGLTAANRIVERHGGRMWARSRKGEGAAFFFTLHAPLSMSSESYQAAHNELKELDHA